MITQGNVDYYPEPSEQLKDLEEDYHSLKINDPQNEK